MKLKNKIVIVVPVYNVENLITQCLVSILNQTFNDLGIIIRDDLSTDKTKEIIRNFFGITGVDSTHFLKFKNKDIIYIENQKKLYPCGNTYESVLNYIENKDTIVGVVDGDDKLSDNFCLEKINSIYEEKKVWMVWTQNKPSSGQPGFSKKLPPDEIIYSSRNYWSVSHFRTQKTLLFHNLIKEDLIDPFDKNSYYKFCGDAAFLFPFIEMCGNQKSFFLDEIFYNYNDNLPLNEHNKDVQSAITYGNFIRQKGNRYKKLSYEEN